LFNASDTSISISGWSLQYAAATAAFTAGNNQVNLSSVTIPAGGYYLIRMNNNLGITVGANITTQDAAMTLPTGGNPGMSTTGAKVALVNTTTTLLCGTAACTPAQLANAIDLVGYGTSNSFEGSVTPAIGTNITSVKRAGGGCTDTDVNSADFLNTGLTAPILRNTATTAAPCF
jgi:uncharacterized protein